MTLDDAQIGAIARTVGQEVGREIAAAIAAALAAPAAGLLPPDELAAALRISTKTLTRLAREGLPARRVGGKPRYDLEEVKSWLKEHGRPAAAPKHTETPPRRVGRRVR